MIVVDTSALIDSLCGRQRSQPRLREIVDRGERVVITSIVLYEWWRGPRTPDEIAVQEELFPPAAVLPFAAAEAIIAANLCSRVKSPRGREIDLAIAACAIARDASLWTLNVEDFADVPGLMLAA